MNYYIQQRFLFTIWQKRKFLLHILVIVDVLVEIKSRIDRCGFGENSVFKVKRLCYFR